MARIAVAATAPFGADVLERLSARHEITGLLTRPDAQQGRGRRIAPPPAKLVAERLGVPVLQPERPERAILAGDTETGVTIHETVEELDAGPIAAQKVFPIGDEDDAAAVFEQAARVAVELLNDVLADASPLFVSQATDGVSYAEKISSDDRRLDLDDDPVG